jgi:RND family efflux transporter MFP subunit
MHRPLSKYLITISIILFVVAAGCGKKNTDKIKVQPEPVQVAKVEKSSIVETKTYSGTLEGIEQASIVSKIAERVTDIKVKVNNFVKNGDILIQLDRSGATSNFLQAQANFENSQKNYERMKALLSDGAISQQQLDQAKTAYDVAKANFDAAKSTVDLESPINGMVTDLNVNIGDWVTPGMQLATVANINQMILKFFVTEAEVANINLGNTVTIYSEFNKKKSVKGKITEISRSASSDARSFQVKAKFNNTKDSWYKPGMFVNVDVTLASQRNVLVVPTDAVIYTNNKNIVFKIVSKRAFQADVTIGLSNENVTEITKGLKEGETIVTAGMNNLADSTEVSIIQ